MPKLDGFEVLELIEPSQAPVVIFVTAYDQYAMRAFDAHAVDYLLKPFSAERFERALERAKARLGERRSPRKWRPRRARRRAAATLAVKDGTRVHVIPLAKLDYVEAQDDYVALHSGGKSYLKQQPIASRGSPARPGAVRAHTPFRHRQPGARGAHRAVREREPRRDSHRRHAAAGEPLRLRAAAGSHGRFAGQPQHHAVDAVRPPA
jgi:two-component system LytT family response regulator